MDRNVLVYGASGHGKVVAELVRALGHPVTGFIDDGVSPGTQVLGVPVLGGWEWLSAQAPIDVLAMGIGGNATRQRVAERAMARGFTWGTFVHPRAWVSPSATLGAGVVVMAGAVVNAEARLGDGVIVNTGAIVEHDCVVGAFAHLAPGSALGGAVRVGARTHVGLNAAVRQLVVVGDDVMVGAGAVVVRDVAEGLTVVGVPARPLV